MKGDLLSLFKREIIMSTRNYVNYSLRHKWLSFSQKLKTINNHMTNVTKNSKNDTNKILLLSTFLRHDNPNSKGIEENKISERICMKYCLTYVNHVKINFGDTITMVVSI